MPDPGGWRSVRHLSAVAAVGSLRMEGTLDASRRAYAVGDYLSGAATAVAAAAPLHAVVEPGWDMVLAMIVGAGVGVVAHLAVLALAGPLVGFFQVMAPGALIGMFGGMLFAVRDSMQVASWPRAIGVAIVFGLLVVGVLDLYDRILRRASAGG